MKRNENELGSPQALYVHLFEDKVVLFFTYEAWSQLGVYFEYRIK